MNILAACSAACTRQTLARGLPSAHIDMRSTTSNFRVLLRLQRSSRQEEERREIAWVRNSKLRKFLRV
jgi:hypothetical protein